MNRNIENNIKIDYIYSFLKSFDLSSAIWVLYMVYKGLPLWQIGLIEGIFHTTSFLFEVPSGILADILGRRRVIITGRLCSGISSIILLFSNSFIGFAIGFIISAISYNLNSGSEEALIYDSLKILGREKEYLKLSGRLNLIFEISYGVATFIGGVLSSYSYGYCYIAAIIVAIIALVSAVFFAEVEDSKDENKEKLSLKEHLNISKDVVKGNREIIKVLIYFPVVETFQTVVYFYGQQYYSLLGLNKIQISIIMLLSGIFSCLGSITIEKLIILLKDKTKYIVSLLMGISIIMISSHNLMISIVFFGIMNFVNAMLYPLQSDSLNKLIPSKQRATIISVNSMIFSLVMICVFPICGFFADIFNLHIVFFALGIMQVTIILLLVSRKKS